MQIAELLNRAGQLKETIAVDTGVSYVHTRRDAASLVRNACRGRTRPEGVTIRRLLVKGRGRRLQSRIALAQQLFRRSQAGVGHELTDLMSLGRNMTGELLLELPEHPDAIRAGWRFLQNLDNELTTKGQKG